MVLTPVIWLWLPLIAAIFSGFTRHKLITFVLLAIELVCALILGRIEPLAIGISTVLLVVAHCIPTLLNQKHSKWLVYLCWTIVILTCGLLFLHRLPGFNNLLVLDHVYAGPQSLPFTMYLNLDKPIAFFALLLAYPQLVGNKQKLHFKGVLLAIVLLVSLLPLASLTGALKIELSLPDWWWLFILNNLMITCVAEEALFRGLIQQSLSRRYAWWIGLITASVLFGLAHIGGGMLLALFATFAGLGYGLIFHFTGRLWCSVLAHFAFNFAHLVFFTYPALAH
ncbi:CPBP family intramembrane metalloprotease domain-containing protein [Vibrio diazotrophicus]|uniref:CPBP family intramembrane metalloprotease domain-containing protein n=1 Tax=Vibrio diazotrophicus TaxID=685 RepID=A0A2J8HYT9_VIBDI|nr:MULTISPECIES: CPBP family intramembrane glutamic endopeptidase [Vibrio]MCF7363613.1 CPBP family intramembrane metalloprotease [Vibrio sp. A1-b2]PNI03435.1 CPBP family intramembrane metalloprotease domain-containing protein [Vibrio diazotrophicus]